MERLNSLCLAEILFFKDSSANSKTIHLLISKAPQVLFFFLQLAVLELVLSGLWAGLNPLSRISGS